ncbi:hypothetical protein, partial [Streptomyces sp. NPDC052015]|uniref:hypothetical protein n=1 Tax=Streptomyces sp. NPDC052015 TaxID=3154755 RepID=UPI00344804B8
LALRTGKPVKIVYNRFESFFGHVHRHPAKLTPRHVSAVSAQLRRIVCIQIQLLMPSTAPSA